MKWLQVRLDDKTHKQFKKKCDKDKTTMTKKVKTWIGLELSGDK